MNYRRCWICGLVCIAAAMPAAAQTPLLSNLDGPYPALQSQIIMAGTTYIAGAVAYGPVNTPLTLSGANFGDNGTIWFIPYKNGARDTNSMAVQAPVSLWSADQVLFKVPAGAVSGLVEIISGSKVSNGLPFIVTNGSYSGSCPAGPSSVQLQISTNSLQDATASRLYSAQLAVTGGSGSYSWSLVSGSLPAGLSLSAAGVISGIPTTPGDPMTFTVQVADTSSPEQHDEAALSLAVADQSETISSSALYSFSIQTPTGGGEGYDLVGNVIDYTDSVNGTWSFTYDSLNRLATAASSQDNNVYPNYCWQYDSFGNRQWQTTSNVAFSASNGGPNACPVTSGPSVSLNFNANNQVSDGLHQFDDAGNMTADTTTGNSYLYDAEGRICAVQQSISGTTIMTQYLYDAEGNRVAKGSIATWSCDTTSNGFNATAVYVLGPTGEQMTEMANVDGNWQWKHTNVFASGLSATYDSDPNGQTGGKMYFQLSDWLGTRRQQTDYAGNPLLNFTGLPYGDGLTTIPVSTTDTADATEHHFTGKERDSESGNDYFGARYYASSMGRFMSPDPLGNFVADVSNPQTWNMYAYALNNPLKFTDPTGYDCAYLNDSGNGIESLDQQSNSQECTKNGGYWADGAITNFQVNDNGGYTFTSLDANLNTLTTNFSGGGNTGSTSSLDVMSYFFNYQIQQRQLQQSPSLWSMSPEQRIKQIALAQPTICGGGAFAYGGRSVDAGPANGFAGGIIEADSNSGVSKGALFEAGGGEGVVGGGGLVVANGSNGMGSEGLVYGGAGVELPGAHASVGEVGFSGGIGVYGDVSAGGREVGAGAYLNVTTNAACMAAHK